MTAFVDVRFRGLRVAHKAKLVESEGGAFVEHEAPLPVGSPLSVVEEGKEERGARVTHVVEHEAGAGAAGMQLAWDSGAVLREAITVRIEKEPAFEETASASAADTSQDVSSDASVDASSDGSSDGTVEAAVQNGNSSKKSKKSKKRR